jgi:sulfur relay (sulfurtransferase) DsrC/TusE family protein
MTDDDRYEAFMNTVLGKKSTTLKPDKDVRTKDIAFAIEHIKASNQEIQKLKVELVDKTPILALLQTLSTVLPSDTVSNLVKELSTESDKIIRARFVKELFYLENISDAAELGNVDIEIFHMRMWKMFTDLLNSPTTHIPANVSSQIQNSIIKKRCGVEPTFLNETGEPLSHFKEVFAEDELLDHALNSNVLCSVVRNLNTVSNATVKKDIKKCLDLIKKYTPSGLGLTPDSEEFKKIQADVDNFMYITHQWDKMSVYICTENECSSKTEKLKQVADQVRSYATTCSSSINKQHKKNLAYRRKNGDKTLTTSEKLWSWF